jgi:hypothetical protein
MTKNEFFDLISRFAQRPVPAVDGRHVYLWHGPLELLKNGIPADSLVQIDLHQMAPILPGAPRSRDEARRLLSNVITTTLNENNAVRQQIFTVIGCDLLSRYEVSLSPFFQVASERQMVILVVPIDETYFRPSHPLPSYVMLDPAAPCNYLKAGLGVASIINTSEIPL